MSGARGRVVRFAGATVALGLLAATVTVGLAHRSGADRALAEEPAAILAAAHDASFIPSGKGDRPLFILALGSDARPGQGITEERADSIHLIGIDRVRDQATILGFPRDSWVPIPGHGSGKINTAMSLGGPELVVATVEQLTNITIDYWVLTWFEAFDQAVDAIGGLTVNVPYEMHDEDSHANFLPGVQTLKGWQALAFARNRHDTPSGDFSRSQNQGLLLRAGLTQLRGEFAADPARLLSWIVAGWRNVQTDLAFSTLFDLALTATQLDPAKVNNLVLLGSGGFIGSSSVVFLSASSGSVFADLRADGVVQHPLGVLPNPGS